MEQVRAGVAVASGAKEKRKMKNEKGSG